MSSISEVSAATAFRRTESANDKAAFSKNASTSALANRPADQVELSSQARAAAGQDSSFRADLVARIRAEIEAGTYETPERLEGALDGLAGDLSL